MTTPTFAPSAQRAAYNAAWRADHRERGICRDCNELSLPGRKRCATHAAAARALSKSQQAAQTARRRAARDAARSHR